MDFQIFRELIFVKLVMFLVEVVQVFHLISVLLVILIGLFRMEFVYLNVQIILEFIQHKIILFVNLVILFVLRVLDLIPTSAVRVTLHQPLFSMLIVIIVQMSVIRHQDSNYLMEIFVLVALTLAILVQVPNLMNVKLVKLINSFSTLLAMIYAPLGIILLI
jgi:hypothetical protein